MTSGGRVGPLDPAALLAAIREIPDFPAPGVLFRDISPLLADPAALATVVEWLAAHADAGRIDKIVGIEARGFILGAALAYRCGIGFVPVRKQGKLPGPTYSTDYALEYGAAVLQVHQDAFAKGDRVLVVDDVLATGGTCAAAVRLVHLAGGVEVVGAAMLLELAALGGRTAMAAAHPEVPVHALLSC